MTFDCENELHKVKKWFPEAELVLRINTPDNDSIWNLNEKFGAFYEDAFELLEAIKRMELNCIGVSFHVGTGGVSINAYEDSIKNARKIFDMAEGLGMPKMNFLDLGGGYSMINPSKNNNFEIVAPQISKVLDDQFPDNDVQIIGEPGTYINESSVYVVSQIILTKEGEKDTKHYYINNSVFKSYMVRQFGDEMRIQPLNPEHEERPKQNSIWWGQTCDSLDWIAKDKQFHQ